MASNPEANEQTTTIGRGPGSTGRAWTWFLLLAGCVAMSVGAVAGSGDALHPRVPWFASELAQAGGSPAALALGGAILFCLGTLRAAIGTVQRRLAGESASGPVLEELSTQVLANRQDAQRILQETHAVGESAHQLLQLSQEHALERANGHHDEASFRLAASVDQLGAGLGKHMKLQGTEAEQRFAAVDHVLERICEQLVELRSGLDAVRTSQERVVEEAAQREAVQELLAQEEAAQESPSWSDDWEPAPSAELSCEIPRSSSPQPFPLRHEGLPSDEQELEIVVTLEEEHDLPEDEACTREEGSLGLLDYIDEFGEYHAPGEPGPEVAPDEPAAREEPVDDTQVEESSMDHQLAQLRSLLSEAELRDVLDGFRRGAEDQLG
jgi:hypothetical protein